MQNRYAGDIGDYIKFGLLAALSKGRRLGVAWYLHPNEMHNSDGKHTSYLNDRERWRSLDPDLYDSLAAVLRKGRSVLTLQEHLGYDALYSGEPISSINLEWRQRPEWRRAWFARLRICLERADLVFADPDNGIVDDDPKRATRKVYGKQIPLHEVKSLTRGRVGVIYHHNTRRPGGHDREVDHWLGELGDGSFAVRANAYGCRTFFIVNADAETRSRATAFCTAWSRHSVRQHPGPT